jgi:radical SAM protein with 4Fe4S-binding SPASM domain
LGNRCLRHKFSCLVGARGEVMPCVGVNLPIGNVRRQPLADILAASQVLKDLKNHRETIKGPCRTCDKIANCYGCRGAAYQLTGDYLASDPLCWHNARYSSDDEAS